MIWPYVVGYILGFIVYQVVVLFLVARNIIPWYKKGDAQGWGLIWPLVGIFYIAAVVLFGLFAPLFYYIDVIEPKILKLFEKKEKKTEEV